MAGLVLYLEFGISILGILENFDNISSAFEEILYNQFLLYQPGPNVIKLL